jgi:hypothetical protein
MKLFEHLIGGSATAFVCFLALSLCVEITWLNMPFMTCLKHVFRFSEPYLSMDSFYMIQR